MEDGHGRAKSPAARSPIFKSLGKEGQEMEGLLFYAPANFWAGLLYACMIVGVIFAEYSTDERKREPADVIHLVIDEEELKRAA